MLFLSFWYVTYVWYFDHGLVISESKEVPNRKKGNQGSHGFLTKMCFSLKNVIERFYNNKKQE